MLLILWLNECFFALERMWCFVIKVNVKCMLRITQITCRLFASTVGYTYIVHIVPQSPILSTCLWALVISTHFSPLLKKSTLDNEQLSNYRPISDLSLISKIIERVVKSFLTICWILTSLPADGTIPQKDLSYTSKSISSLLLVHKNYLVSVSLISLLPLTP